MNEEERRAPFFWKLAFGFLAVFLVVSVFSRAEVEGAGQEALRDYDEKEYVVLDDECYVRTIVKRSPRKTDSPEGPEKSKDSIDQVFVGPLKKADRPRDCLYKERDQAGVFHSGGMSEYPLCSRVYKVEDYFETRRILVGAEPEACS